MNLRDTFIVWMVLKQNCEVLAEVAPVDDGFHHVRCAMSRQTMGLVLKGGWGAHREGIGAPTRKIDDQTVQ